MLKTKLYLSAIFQDLTAVIKRYVKLANLRYPEVLGFREQWNVKPC